MTFHSQLNGKSSISHVPITTNITKQILCFMDSNYNGISITNIIRSSIPMYSSGCVWQWAAPPSDIQQEWFGSFYLLRRSLFNAYGDHRSLEEIHGNSNQWPQEHSEMRCRFGYSTLHRLGREGNLLSAPTCFLFPDVPRLQIRNQPTCLSWGPSVSCAKLEVCPAQIKTTSHLDVPHHGARGKCGRPVSAIIPLQATIG